MLADNEVQRGKLYRYKGNEYFVLFDDAETKTDDGWIPAVVYYPADNPNDAIYVRELEDFKEKFELV